MRLNRSQFAPCKERFLQRTGCVSLRLFHLPHAVAYKFFAHRSAYLGAAAMQLAQTTTSAILVDSLLSMTCALFACTTTQQIYTCQASCHCDNSTHITRLLCHCTVPLISNRRLCPTNENVDPPVFYPTVYLAKPFSVDAQTLSTQSSLPLYNYVRSD